MDKYGKFAEIEVPGCYGKPSSKSKTKIQSGEFTDESEVTDFHEKNDKTGGTGTGSSTEIDEDITELESRIDTLIEGR